jgi:signal transduction histidine kinase
VVLVALTNRSLDRVDRARMRLAAVLLEEAERRHIARELHDEIGQSLTALKLNLEAETPHLAETRALVDDLMGRVSALSLELRPAMLDDLGLLPALLWLFDRYHRSAGLEVEFVHEGIDGRLQPMVETAAYRIVQESLSNAAKHAAVNQVAVRVVRRDGRLHVTVEDRGRGFDPQAAFGRSTGLSGMRERAAALQGRLDIDSTIGRGTCLTAELPVTP